MNILHTVVSFVAQHYASAFGAHGAILAAATLAWPDPNRGANPVKRGNAALVTGGLVRQLAQAWAKAAADGNGTIYYLAALPADAIMEAAALCNDALAGCTSVDLGLYRFKDDGSVQTNTAGGGAGTGGAKSDGSDAGAVFISAMDISAGFAIGSDKNGLLNYGHANFGKKIWELLGFTDPKLKDDIYILGLRLNTAGAAVGNLSVRARWIQG